MARNVPIKVLYRIAQEMEVGAEERNQFALFYDTLACVETPKAYG